ncbi:hypothetical protein DCAR_0521564 [Daucus carota subsp. sativus]|uniref:Uncharacterized protein n=1 Tax=Daucus carota subsp. sativus TaxID=79200 RepID=A0A162A5B6_DAUCS|nr:hypothetical protein DCAR_0521564 [Daucus carota subsp. sativus]
MELSSATPSNNKKKQFPPKRGQIKEDILKSFATSLSNLASKAGEVVSKIKQGSTSSAAASPPSSSYNSDD